MSAENTLILTSLFLRLLEQMQSVGQLIAKTRAEGREPSDAELNALGANDDAVKYALQVEIDRQAHAGG